MILATVVIFLLPAFPAPAQGLAAAAFQKESGSGLSSSDSSPAQSPSNSPPAADSAHPQSSDKGPDKDAAAEKSKVSSQSSHTVKKTKSKKSKKHAAKKTPSTDRHDRTRIVRHGSAPEPALKFAPTLSEEQLAKQRQHTTELLAASDANLKNTAGKQLNPAQQDTVSKVRNYMQQATAADKSGDLQRAQALASKAKQLSDDLVAH